MGKITIFTDVKRTQDLSNFSQAMKIINRAHKKVSMLRKLMLVTFCLGSIQILEAQFTDDFSDGDFSVNPSWTGTSNSFIVNSAKQLQLNAPVEGIAWLSTASSSVEATEWRFWIKLAFSPSANNFARVYLISDEEDLTGPLNGYYLQFGETGSNDAIELFKQQGTNTTSICRGTNGSIASAFAIRIKVVHKPDGEWLIYSDPAGNENFQLQAIGSDVSITAGNRFGIFSKFTSSNITKMYFDDFYTGPIIIDTIPPVLQLLTITSDSSLLLKFSEPLEPSSAQNTTNYLLSPGDIHPFQANFLPNDASSVQLIFSHIFQSGVNYTLSINNLTDLSGNNTGMIQHHFCLYSVKPYDIVINEIMADPEPSVGMPLWEYIELFNTTSVEISLKDWKLKIGNTLKILPEVSMGPQSYLILCRPEAKTELSAYGITAPITSFLLNNTGQDLQLLDKSNVLVSKVSYTDKWYRDVTKSNGGWSLEQIDPLSPCLGSKNWIASINISGGTPGGINSVYSTNQLFPLPEMVIPIPPHQLNVVFNQSMDSLSLTNLANYSLLPKFGNPSSIELVDSDFTTLILYYSESFDLSGSYRLVFSTQLFNCIGQAIPENIYWDFNIPSPSKIFDVLITEVMADPDPPIHLPNAEYVEIYNCCDYTVDLSGWSFSIENTDHVFDRYYLKANEYLILAHEKYASDFATYGNFYGFSSFSLPNTGQSLVLKNGKGEAIHWVDYDQNMYGKSPKKDGGWSLEMIDTENPCTIESNWIPSIDPHGGTPGRKNSVSASLPDTISPRFSRIYPLSPKKIWLYFSEPVKQFEATNPENYVLSDGLTFLKIQAIDHRNKVFEAELSSELKPAIIYTVSAKNGITDCAGNCLSNNKEIIFGLPLRPARGKLVINEILTNPLEGGSDYLEVYNSSDTLSDLGELALSYISSSGSSTTIFLPPFLLLPSEYYCLTRNPLSVINQYPLHQKDNFVQVKNFQDLSSSGGTLILYLKEDSTKVIDRFSYSSSMHLPILKNFDGVSLERINPLRPTDDPTNWTSASEASGFGTPAHENSQYSSLPVAKGSLTIEPEIFSPDGDGIDDIVNITIQPPAEGYITNVTLFDSRGRLVKHLVKNLIVGNKCTISWNGMRYDNSRAPVGFYIIYCELFDTNGSTEKHKATVVVGAKL